MIKEYSLKKTAEGLKVEGYNITIKESKILNGEIYPLTNKEILSVLDFFKVINQIKTIEVNNHKLVNVQAFVIMDGKTMKFNGELNLNVPSNLAKKHFNKLYGYTDNKQYALFTLMHEIGHIKGHIPEEDADKFAIDNMNKVWMVFIKPKRIFV